MDTAVTLVTFDSERVPAKDVSNGLSPEDYSLTKHQLEKYFSQPISGKFNIATHSVNWGRKFQISWASSILSFGIVTLCPCLVIFTWIALEKFDGSLTDAGLSLLSYGIFEYMLLYGPRFCLPAFTAYIAWFLFQAGLYSYLPSPLRTGQLTPGGHLLK
jgi:7-dehydrocholesterol reductase